jgi:hypothetical protein
MNTDFKHNNILIKWSPLAVLTVRNFCIAVKNNMSMRIEIISELKEFLTFACQQRLLDSITIPVYYVL